MFKKRYVVMAGSLAIAAVGLVEAAISPWDAIALGVFVGLSCLTATHILVELTNRPLLAFATGGAAVAIGTLVTAYALH